MVIVPTLTFIAAVNPVRYVGADPVFLDCDDSLCICPQELERYLQTKCEMRNDGKLYDITQNRPVKALIVVHVYGNGADMQQIMRLANQHNLLVIEDATEAMGSFYTGGVYKGKMCGTIGSLGAYSFNGNKIITTGGGGMLTSLDPQVLNRARHLSTQAKVNEFYYMHDEVGYNYRLTNLQAALGVAQLEQIQKFIQIKKDNFEHYLKCGVELLPFSDRICPNYWFYSYLCEDRDGLMQYLAAQKIQVRPLWGLVHEQPMYRDCTVYKVERAKYYQSHVVNLPCSSNLTKKDVEQVADAIHQFKKEQG